MSTQLTTQSIQRQLSLLDIFGDDLGRESSAKDLVLTSIPGAEDVDIISVEDASIEINAAKKKARKNPAPKQPKQPKQTVVDPVLDLNDENCEFFAREGVRALISEMILQSAKDMVLSGDDAKMQELRESDPESYAEIMDSAAWLDTTDGRLAVQCLYPDWPVDKVLNAIKSDPQGVISRYSRGWQRKSTESDVLSLNDAHISVYEDVGFIEYVDENSQLSPSP